MKAKNTYEESLNKNPVTFIVHQKIEEAMIRNL